MAHQSLLLQETLVALKMAVLLHVDGDGLAGGDEGVILRGTGHGDLVRSLALAFKRPLKPLLILIVHVHVGIDQLESP